jgi:hypothetical protein
MKAPFLIADIETNNSKFEFIKGKNIQILDVLDWWGLSAWLKENANIDYDYNDYINITAKFPGIPVGEDVEDAYKYYEEIEVACWKLKNKPTRLKNGKAKLQASFLTDASGNYLLSTDFYVRWVESLRKYAELMRANKTKPSLVWLEWNLTTSQDDWSNLVVKPK